MRLKIGDKVAIVACSNGQPTSTKEKFFELLKVLKAIGLIPIYSKFIFEGETIFSGSSKERAEALMEFYKAEEIKAIFDVSGGDIANELLQYMDFEMILRAKKPFFGYSDLTTIINAIYAKTGIYSYLYQIKNLVYDNGKLQLESFIASLFNNEEELFKFNYNFLQGSKMEGKVIGGNIRCFLKLAGTEYMPEFYNKILFLEAYGGDIGVLTSLLMQLKYMKVFEKINGVILGTFTKIERENSRPTIDQVLAEIVNNRAFPIVKTREIGHGTDAKALIIGKSYTFK